MRSDTAFFSAADISRRFLAGLASDLLSAAAAAFVGEEERRDVERAVGVDAPRICSTSVNALISAWRRSISLWRLAIACAISFMALESSDPAMGMSTRRGGRRDAPQPGHEAHRRRRWQVARTPRQIRCLERPPAGFRSPARRARRYAARHPRPRGAPRKPRPGLPRRPPPTSPPADGSEHPPTIAPVESHRPRRCRLVR